MRAETRSGAVPYRSRSSELALSMVELPLAIESTIFAAGLNWRPESCAALSVLSVSRFSPF